MKNIKNQDERVVNQRRKIQSDGYQLLVYALLISVVVQQFLLQAPLSQYMAEFLCLVGIGFYNLICNMRIGNNLYGEDKDSGKKILKNTLLGGILSLVIFVILSGEKDTKTLIIYYLTFIIGFGGINYLLYYLSKRKQDKIEKELDMDEDDIE